MTAADASTIPAEQMVRLGKIATEPFFLITHPAAEPYPRGTLTFVVSGSTRERHVVSIDGSGRVACTCMDARTRCRRCRCICKHGCFVLVRVLRLSDATFYSRLRLSEHDLRVSSDVVAGRTTLHDAVFRPLLSTQQQSSLASQPVSFRGFRVPEPEDECPVCYTALLPESGDDPLRGCPDCGQAVHRGCMTRWALCSNSPSLRSCVMCRSPAWSAWAGD